MYGMVKGWEGKSVEAEKERSAEKKKVEKERLEVRIGWEREISSRIERKGEGAEEKYWYRIVRETELKGREKK